MLHYRNFWLFLAWLIFIFIIVFSLIPVPGSVVITIPYVDKIEHFVSYLILMFLFALCYRQKNTRMIYAGVFICVGGILEILQSFTVARLFEYADMIANTSGVLVGWKISDGYLFKIIILIERRLKRLIK